MNRFKLDWLILPLLGILIVIGLWAVCSATWAKELPSPVKTWQASRDYILKPFEKRGEMDQGILRFTWYSLTLVAQGYALALLIGTPIGFCLGLSKAFTKTFDPIIQILRPVSPLAWLPLGLVLFLYSFSLIHHMLGGLRHFVWDMGKGYEPETRMKMAKFTLVGSVSLTVLVWIVALVLR